MRALFLISLGCLSVAGCAMTSDAPHADTHTAHTHVHGEDCGHKKVMHDGHWDYLHDGHLHHVHGDHVDEHTVEVTDKNPAGENTVDASTHAGHMHSASSDEHPMIRHGDHVDHIHNGRLHHVHDGHVDDHGAVTVQANG